MLTFFKRRKILKKVNTLDLSPIKNYCHEINQDNLVTVLVPKFKNQFLNTFLASKFKSDHFRIKLDKFGSEVWLRFNGVNSVNYIINDLKKKYKDELPDAENRIMKFIFQLYEQNFITFEELKNKKEKI